MRTIADHIYDIAYNSVKAKSEKIDLFLGLDSKKREFYFNIEDNGGGMSKEVVAGVFNPFYTSRDKSIRKVGLGLPLLKQNAELCKGDVKLESVLGEGTKLTSYFKTDSFNFPDLGDIGKTLAGLICSTETSRWFIKVEKDGASETISTDEILGILGEDISLNNLEVIDTLNGIVEMMLLELDFEL